MDWLTERKENTRRLQQAVEKIGREFETLTYEELQRRDESTGTVESEGDTYEYSAFSYDFDPESGTVYFCIDIRSKMPVWPPGLYPSWQFSMQPDGTVERG